MLSALILAAVVVSGAVLAYPRLANASLWRAAVTPLASIIGSGFLVLGPILEVSYGALAPLTMAVLCLAAYLFGNAIRFNIRQLAGGAGDDRRTAGLETLASALLGFAYIISVAYYLNLLGAFGVKLTVLDDPHHARLLTTAVFILILAVGWARGFTALERLGQVTVGVKLAIIAGLICGLAVYFGKKASNHALLINPPEVSGWAAITLLFGLIVTVQGFETSRYLGEDYEPATRVRSMRLAQIVSTLIYMTYIGLLAYVFEPGTLTLDETAIIDLMSVVAPILPVLLVAAALSAQLSAAVADTSGSGGLFEEVSGGRISPKLAYTVLVAIGITLTWTLDVFRIIGYASRAFALYYAVQAAIAARLAWRSGNHRLVMLYVPLVLLGLAIAVFGRAVE